MNRQGAIGRIGSVVWTWESGRCKRFMLIRELKELLIVASGYILNCMLAKLSAKCSTNIHLQSEKDLKHAKRLARTR